MIKQTFFILLTGVLAFSCKKETPTPKPVVEDTDNNGQDVNAFFIKAKIDNTEWTAIELQNGCRNQSVLNAVVETATDSLSVDSVTVNYSSYFLQDGQTSQITAPLNGKLYLKMANFKHTVAEYYASDFLFHETFQIGNQAFASDSTVRGVEIVYVDNNQVEWSSKYGSQAGSSVVFTLVKNEPVLTGEKIKLVRGIFSGKVYNQAGTSFKLITSGSYYLQFKK